LPATRWSRPATGKAYAAGGKPKEPQQRAESVLALASFRVGCERRGALEEASGGWDGFLYTQAIA
jgi:hypothetical protein